MIRGGLIVVFSALLACAPLPVQNSASEAAVSSAYPRYASGFEIFNPAEDPKDLGFYGMTALGKIRSKWYPQIPALQKSIGHKSGVTIVEFEIGRDGSVRKMKTVGSASDSSLDRAATNAISSAAPFDPLPQAYHEKALRLSMRFGYEQPGSAEAPFCDGPDRGAHQSPYVLHYMRDGITPPKATYAPDPEFSDQARKARYQSSVQISGTVDPQGAFTDLCVSKAAGWGLDENAMEAVRKWKFEPATLSAEPVAVRINVDVTFSLY